MSLSHIIIYIVSIFTITSSQEADITSSTKPNILFILAGICLVMIIVVNAYSFTTQTLDDLGWGKVGFHNTENSQIKTPYIDDLVANGLELYRHYVYSGCAPSRASLQTGRLPVHVTTNNGDGIGIAIYIYRKHQTYMYKSNTF